MFKVAVIIGSLRKESFNRKLALALDKLEHPTLQFSFISIDDIPLYNQDKEQDFPLPVTKFKNDITAADAVLFVTPEYNRSIPGVLKNSIDWGSRPYGKSAWAGKPAAIIGASPGSVGTAVAQSHLRSVLTALDMILFGLPEVYIVYKEGLFDNLHNITVDSTKKFLQGFLDSFSRFVQKNTAVISMK